MNGQLAQQPPVELVKEISLKGLSGTLRLHREQVKVAVYFEAGRVIYAASNLRELRIGEYLKKQGLASEENLAALGNNRSDLALVSQLCANGTLTREGVVPLVAAQVADLLRIALLWSNGTWEFDDRAHLRDPIRVRVNTASLLMQTARNMPVEFILSRFRDPDELISPVAAMPDYAGLLPAEGFVLSRVEAPLRLNELFAISGLGEREVSRTIYALILAGFLQREHGPKALQSEPRIVPDPAGRSQTPEKSIKIEAPSSPTVRPVKSEEEELNEFFERLDKATDHYEVLKVAMTAETEEIKNSYYALARRYHPDRFHLQASTPLHARIESAFARLAQAYGTLTDAALRLTYDSKLAAQDKVKRLANSAPKASAPAPVTADKPDVLTKSEQSVRDSAENSFKEGFAALQEGQTKQAVIHLSAAARIVPHEPRYRAYYGRALAAVADTRRLAEAEMQAAIKLDPGNASYRCMLAELYCDLGFYKRAEGEIERAIAADPNNTAARALLRRVGDARLSKKISVEA